MGQANGARALRRVRNGVFIALGVVSASVASMAVMTRAVHAQSQQHVAFDIPAGPLSGALAAFGRQAGLQVTYLPEIVSDKSTGGVSGNVAPRDALDRLLQGSGLSYRFSGARTITIERLPTAAGGPQGAIPLDRIDVRGLGESAWGPVSGVVAKRSASATKTDTPLLEVPQSVTVITADQVARQAAESVGETLHYAAGTRGDIYGYSTQRDYVRVRGFSPNYYLDGLILPYGITAQGGKSEPYGLERIEVLRGPSSVMFGQNPPGGIINMVSKRPIDEARREVFIRGGSHGRVQGGFDLTGPITADKTLQYRVVGMARNGGTDTRHADDDRYYFAPSLSWRPSESTSLTVLAQVQRDRAGINENYFPALGTLYRNPLGKVSTRTHLGEPGSDKLKRDQFFIGYEFSHRFDNGVTFKQNARYAYVDVYTATTFTLGIQPDNRTINRSFSVINRKLKYLTVDSQVLADVEMGPLTHRVIAGLDWRRGSERALNGGATAPDLDIFNPVYGRPFGPFVYDQKYVERAWQLGFYAQDQIRFGRWLLTLGGRFDWADTTRKDYIASSASTVKDHAFTGRAGLTYLFDNGLAPYVSYSTSFEPVLASASPARGATLFKPTTGRQFEVGVKYQPTWFNGLFTAAYFDLAQRNVSTTDPEDVRYSVQTGAVRVRGVELEAHANITAGLSLIGAHTYLDTEITKTNNPAERGGRLPSIPKHQASLWAQYAFQEGPLSSLTVGGGVRYVGASYGDAANLWRAPSYTLFDASLGIDLGRIWPEVTGASFQLNANNLFDKKTVNICFYDAACVLGQRRTVSATLKYRW